MRDTDTSGAGQQNGEPLRVRHPQQQYRTLGEIPLPPTAAVRSDVVDILLEEREDRS